MTEREKIIATVLEEVLDSDLSIDILNQCLGLYRYLDMFKDGEQLKEIFGEDGMEKVRKKTCKFSYELMHSEVLILRDELLEKLYCELENDSLSYVQMFRVLVAYVFMQGENLNNVENLPDTPKINFLKYCYKNMSKGTCVSEFELAECCEALKLL